MDLTQWRIRKLTHHGQHRTGGAECDIYDCLVKSRDGPGLRRGLGYVGGVACRQHPI